MAEDKEGTEKGSTSKPSFPLVICSAMAPKRVATGALRNDQDSKKDRGKGSFHKEGITENAERAQRAG